jgi:hypothetical protein
MVTQIEGSGRTREPGEVFRKELIDADSLDDSGYVLKSTLEATIYKVEKADSGEFPIAVNMRSTRDAFSIDHPNTTFLLGSSDRLPSIDCIDDGEVKLKVDDDNAAIVPGDPLVVGAGAGKVDKYTPTVVTDSATTITRFIELGEIVGYAVEAAAAGGGGDPGVDKVRTRLTIKMVPTIA